jgi:hypothetical protein
LVGGLSATVALGRETVGAPPGSGIFAVFRAIVGAPTGALVVASLIVGAPDAVGAPAVRRGMVGAGAGILGAVGAPEGGMVAVGGLGAIGGATGGLGGLIVGAGLTGRVAEGTAGGASAAFRVTRTVSFFNGTLEVCLDGVLFSLSLMPLVFGGEESNGSPPVRVKPTSRFSGKNPLEQPDQSGECHSDGATDPDLAHPSAQRPDDQEGGGKDGDLGEFDPDVETDKGQGDLSA